MGRGNESKHKLAQALESLLEHQPVLKISVSDICAESDLSRQTFYRHFKDIYDLVDWQHGENMHLALQIFAANKDIEEVFRITMQIMCGHRNFYQQIICMEGANSFASCYSTKFKDMYLKLANIDNIDDEIMFSIDIYAMGAAQIILEWIQDMTAQLPEDVAKKLAGSIPANLHKYHKLAIAG